MIAHVLAFLRYCLLVSAGCLGINLALAQTVEVRDTSGTEFVLSFMPNYTGASTLSVIITARQDANGTVSVPGLGFSAAFSVQADQVTTVVVPNAAQSLPANSTSQHGILVTSDKPVHVYGLNRQQFTTDAFMGLPARVLGDEYRVITHAPPGGFTSQVAIVAAQDATDVVVTPNAAVPGHPAGQPYTLRLNRLQTHLVTSTGDLTGTRVSSSAPVGVYGGVQCANIPVNVSACDHIVEMMPPVTAWGSSFLTVPLATRLRGDLVRILAAQDGTVVNIDGQPAATLAAGAYYERIATNALQISSSSPVLVAQYSVGQSYDGVVSDPFMMLVPPTQQFLRSYVFSTPEVGFPQHFVNVVAPTEAIATVQLDGVIVNSALFVPIGQSGFSGAKVPLPVGSHRISAGAPIGIYVYGFGSFDSYGYPGGMSMRTINPIDVDYRNVRVIETLEKDGLDLDVQSFSVEPAHIRNLSDRVEVEWLFEGYSIGQVENLDHDILVRNPVGGERRLVTRKVELVYEDLNGIETRRTLDPQYVEVLPSILEVQATLDRSVYGPDEVATVNVELTNVGRVASTNTVRITIVDANGALVTTVASQPSLTVAPGAPVSIGPFEFSTSRYLTGSYTARVEVLDTQNRGIAQASTAFSIVSPGAAVAVALTTDKPIYAAWDSVDLASRVRNTALNAVFAVSVAELTVRSPANDIVFSRQFNVPELVPNALRDLTAVMPLVDAQPGVYSASVILRDLTQTQTFASASHTFTVERDTLQALRGSVSVQSTRVPQGTTNLCTDTITNAAASTLTNVQLTRKLVSLDNEAVIETSQSTMSFAAKQQHVLLRSIATQALPEGGYACVLSVTVDGTTRPIGSAGFEVVKPPIRLEASMTLGALGRLLVLMDGGGGWPCTPLRDIELWAPFRSPLPISARIEIELLDANDRRVDLESVTLSQYRGSINRSRGAGVDLSITGASPDVLTVQVANSGGLGAGYRIVATATVESLPPIRLETSVMGESCGWHAGVGARFGDFHCSGGHSRLGGGLPKPLGTVPALNAQRTFLEQFLEEAGWSYTIVTDDEAFERELRTGGYSQYALFAEHEKLDEQVQKELREAVFRGEGLLDAGQHDRRHHGFDAALGISPFGRHVFAKSVQFDASWLPPQPAALLLKHDALRARLSGAQPAASFTGVIGSDTAVSVYDYGRGRSVYVGYDLLAEATHAGAASGHAQLLKNALIRVHPSFDRTQAGQVIPIKIAVHNRGIATTAGRVVMPLPQGVALIDQSQAQFENNTLTWSFDLAVDAQRSFDAWLRLPDESEAVLFDALVQSGNGPVFLDQTHATMSVNAFEAGTIDEAISLTRGSLHYITVRFWLEKARFWLERGHKQFALTSLVQATDEVIRVAHPQAAQVRLHIDDAIWRLGQELE